MAVHLIPQFLQMPIDGIDAPHPPTRSKGRGRDAALARGGNLRVANTLRLEPRLGALPDADELDEPAESDIAEQPASLVEQSEADAMPMRGPDDSNQDDSQGIDSEGPVDLAPEPQPGALSAADSAAMLADMESRFGLWLDECGLISPDAAGRTRLFASLGERYQAPGHQFNNLPRLASELDLLADWRAHGADVPAIALAIWFATAVLEPGRFDNVPRSAEFARSSLTGLGLDGARIRTIRDLIVSTRPDVLPTDGDARLLADIGRAWLADAPDQFDAAEAALREQNSYMPDFIYRRRRTDMIRAMLTKPRVFVSDAPVQPLEQAARANLARRLESLQRSR